MNCDQARRDKTVGTDWLTVSIPMQRFEQTQYLHTKGNLDTIHRVTNDIYEARSALSAIYLYVHMVNHQGCVEYQSTHATLQDTVGSYLLAFKRELFG